MAFPYHFVYPTQNLSTWLQKAQRAIDDIDKRVLEISNKAHIYYSTRELAPYMDNLRDSIDDTVKKTEDLMKVLECGEIFRYSWNFKSLLFSYYAMLGIHGKNNIKRTIFFLQ